MSVSHLHSVKLRCKRKTKDTWQQTLLPLTMGGRKTKKSDNTTPLIETRIPTDVDSFIIVTVQATLSISTTHV
jgi:hypothetical protein